MRVVSVRHETGNIIVGDVDAEAENLSRYREDTGISS